jgi:hypothetical protein
MAACVALSGADAQAQTAAPPFPDPLVPTLQTDPRNPPRFQKFTRPGLVQLGPPAKFSPPASGAGVTGFDSTNSRRKNETQSESVNGQCQSGDIGCKRCSRQCEHGAG